MLNGKRVATTDAKFVLDQLLLHMTKNKIAKFSGISHRTLTNIDNLARQTVEKPIFDMLDKLIKQCSTSNL